MTEESIEIDRIKAQILLMKKSNSHIACAREIAQLMEEAREKDTEIALLRGIQSSHDAEIARLKADNRELAKELGVYHRNYNLVSPKIDALLQRAEEGKGAS